MDQIATGLLRLRADNPSPMTHTGTNSYIIGNQRLSIIDPGPDLPEHRAAILAAVAGRPVERIIVTHSHLDHSPLAKPLGTLLNCPVLAFGRSEAGRSPVMQDLAAAGLAGGGEGVDPNFVPDQEVTDGTSLETDVGALRIIHTPGHMGNHISIGWQDAVFTGDLVMGWASSLVSPPDGDLTDFYASCARLLELRPRVLYPGHGAPVEDPEERINWLISHRNSRSAQICAALADGPATVDALTARVYTDVPPAMHPAAARNLFAHLVHLTQTGRVTHDGPLAVGAVFRLK